VVLPIIGLLAWLLLAASFVRVPSGSLGLVMIKGKATDKALPPGGHFVPALRRQMIEEYPSVELAYRAGAAGGKLRQRHHRQELAEQLETAIARVPGREDPRGLAPGQYHCRVRD
jgi:hypothetical protein